MQQLGPFDAASDDVLVRRQPGGRLGLPGEVVALKRATAAICPKIRPVSRCPSMYSTTARSCPRGSVTSSPRGGWRGPRRAVFGGRPDDRRLVRPILRALVRRHRRILGSCLWPQGGQLRLALIRTVATVRTWLLTAPREDTPMKSGLARSGSPVNMSAFGIIDGQDRGMADLNTVNWRRAESEP